MIPSVLKSLSEFNAQAGRQSPGLPVIVLQNSEPATGPSETVRPAGR